MLDQITICKGDDRPPQLPSSCIFAAQTTRSSQSLRLLHYVFSLEARQSALANFLVALATVREALKLWFLPGGSLFFE